MKRRRALKQIGAGLTAGMLLPTWLSSCVDKTPAPEIDYHGIVGIIGAGAAGLYAADILMSKGVRVKIFEASDRPGGRIRNLTQFDLPTGSLQFNPDLMPNNDFPTELGAERVLGTDSTWATMLQQMNVPIDIFSANTQDNYLLDGALVLHEDALLDADFVSAENYFNMLLPAYNGANISVQQALQNAGINPRMYAILNSWIGNAFGTNNERLGIKALAQGLQQLTRNSDKLILKNNPMRDALLSRFSDAASKIQLNTVIKSIDYSGDQITLSGEQKTDGGIESFSDTVDKVIVTVPVSILKSGLINFTPALPAAKTTSLSKMEMEASLRIILEFKKNLWGDNTAFLFGGSVSPEYFSAGIHRSQYNKTISATINGPQAAILSALSTDDAIQQVLTELDLLFPDQQASANVRKDDSGKPIGVVMDWSKEPYIQGGMAYVKVGGTNDDRVTLAAPVANKIFFAGEATATKGDSGTINGALQSAERVVDEVKAAIQSA